MEHQKRQQQVPSIHNCSTDSSFSPGALAETQVHTRNPTPSFAQGATGETPALPCFTSQMLLIGTSHIQASGIADSRMQCSHRVPTRNLP